MSKAIDGKEAIVVAYSLPSVGQTVELDRHCPHCQRNAGISHSALRWRTIQDVRTRRIPQRRMKCPYCHTTWTLRADGVLPGHQRTQRLRGMGVLLYMLGLSYRGVATFLRALECPAGKSSIERDVAAAGQKARALHEEAPGARVRVLGVDGTGDARAGTKGGLVFFVDIERQKLLLVEPIQESDTRRVRRHVRRVLAQTQAEELRTDEHSVYAGAAGDRRHGLCLTHWRKSKGKRAWDLLQQARRDARPLEAQTMKEVLALLRLQPRPPTPPAALERLVRRYIRARKGLPWKINQLLQHVERTWAQVSDDPHDPTNNTTERLIGLTFKIRTKTMRGFKASSKIVQHAYLGSCLRGQGGMCDLSQVL